MTIGSRHFQCLDPSTPRHKRSGMVLERKRLYIPFCTRCFGVCCSPSPFCSLESGCASVCSCWVGPRVGGGCAGQVDLSICLAVFGWMTLQF
ncbi:hypothetical protein ANANG_G00152890 [Anguilla anguilla]|uniref:Uncharacterized protein n=1 Tax=Anguilla anguilla TaxID=7936 RepID=A0A9D3M8S4_ANGAN|nr:hypothetical protein ANANG_G00152890 [Anguilla anguilla]